MASVTVISVEAVPSAVRGTLTRWMIEPITGVFVGPLPASVREEVWTMVTRTAGPGKCCLIHPADNEQGFIVHTHGEARRTVVDLDGLQLIAFQ